MNLELELRGELKKDEYENLLGFFSKKGKRTKEFKRFQMLYFEIKSDKLDEHKDVKKDFRLRIENGQPMLVLKYGTWHDFSGREEYSIPFDKAELDQMVKMLYRLGYDYGKIMLQHTIVFRYKEIEWSIVEVPAEGSAYYYYEAEIISSKSEEQKNQKRLQDLIEELKLGVFQSDEFVKFCDKLNTIPGTGFDFCKNYNFSQIRKIYSEYI